MKIHNSTLFVLCSVSYCIELVSLQTISAFVKRNRSLNSATPPFFHSLATSPVPTLQAAMVRVVLLNSIIYSLRCLSVQNSEKGEFGRTLVLGLFERWRKTTEQTLKVEN